MDLQQPLKPVLQRGCFMTQGLYLKANGELPCWDDVGESRILRRLDPEALANGLERNISSFRELEHIRTSFAEGEYPHPGLCETCAVRSAGLPHEQVDRTVLQVLHVEPSWMCHLSCPQCIPQKLRKSLKGPPYHLTPEMYEGFLKQLRAEGVAEIRLVIFEGRGDPLTSMHMEALLQLTKDYYPKASTCITTHGSFPYKDWIARSKLDVIRFSVDGARQENYGKYRINGKLDLILTFIERLQADKPSGSRLYIEWKYILFEWNDTDEELAEASAIAARLGVQLRFCRTHSPGRSVRLGTAREVAEMIARVAPNALQDLTFQLKDDDDFTDVGAVRLDQVRGLLVRAGEYFAKGDPASGWVSAVEAMELDGGGMVLPVEVGTLEQLESVIIEQSHKISSAVACSALVDLFSKAGLDDSKSHLLKRYVELAPDAPDRRHVELDLATMAMLDAHAAGDAVLVEARAAAALDHHLPVSGLIDLLGAGLSANHPGLVVAMANIFEASEQIGAAILMFERYLALAPEATDWSRVALHARRLRGERLVQMSEAAQRRGQTAEARALMCEAAATDTAAHIDSLPDYATLALKARDIGLVERICAVAVAARDFEGAYHAEHRLRTEA